MKLSEWQEWVLELYENLPDEFHNSSLRNVFRDISNDLYMKEGVVKEKQICCDVVTALCEFVNSPDEKKKNVLLDILERYYNSNTEPAFIEERFLAQYKNKPMMPMFVLSYGRWGRNATLNFLESLDDQEIFDNTFVFVNPDQEEKYKQGHPRFNYYAVEVDTVGERMLEVLKFCKHWGIERAFVMEDDIFAFYRIIKCGLNRCRCSKKSEPLDAKLFKYIQYISSDIMDKDENCPMVRIRNRAHSNTAGTPIFGHEGVTVGGTPDLCWFLDINRFYKIYKQIPERFYTPQYDWAILCAMLKNRCTWYVLTGVAKGEYMGSSVIKYEDDRQKLAEEIIEYFDVADMAESIVIRSKRGSIKLRCKRKKGKIVNYED